MIRRIAVGPVVLLVVTAGTAWLLAARSLPAYSGEVRVTGLSAPVTIRRDAYAVPHIFGESDADVVFALGYAHAQDRLWQMDILRRTAQGRLSERFGARTLGIDEVMRRFDLAGAAQTSVAAQSDLPRAALDAQPS